MPPEEESLLAQWAAAEATAAKAEGETPDAETKAEPAKTPEPTEVNATEQPEAKTEPEPDAEPEDEGDTETRNLRKRERLEKYAKELGLTIDGDRVTIEDRVKFRDEQRTRQKALRARSEELDAREAAMVEADKAKGEKYHRLVKAIEEEDLDAIADIAGAKSWDELNRQFLIKRSSPLAKEQALLKKQLEEERAARQREKAEAEEKANAARIESERKAYFAELSDDVDDAEDEGVRSMAKVDGFKELVLRQEQEAYDPERNVTITRAEAMKRAHDIARKQYEALHAVFGGKAQESPTEKPKRGTKPSMRQDTGPRTQTEFDTSTPEGERAFMKHWEAQFRQVDR